MAILIYLHIKTKIYNQACLSDKLTLFQKKHTFNELVKVSLGKMSFYMSEVILSFGDKDYQRYALPIKILF